MPELEVGTREAKKIAAEATDEAEKPLPPRRGIKRPKECQGDAQKRIRLYKKGQVSISNHSSPITPVKKSPDSIFNSNSNNAKICIPNITDCK